MFLSPLDRLIDQADHLLRALTTPATDPYPETIPQQETELSPTERTQVARLMRVNHAGEVAAQALYHGHALLAHEVNIYQAMRQAGEDERAHLQWTAARLRELNSHRSILTPLWYAGSFAIGATTAWLGDGISLGFVAETERQVVTHLHGHLAKLPIQDQKSRAILEHMITDESRHATQAVEAGAKPLPWMARLAMRFTAKIMTTTAYWL